MMERVNFPRLAETCYFERLENGLPIYVAVKPEFEKSYAFFATSYGGMDMRFQLDGKWEDTPAGVAHYLEHKMFDMPDGNALMQLSASGASPNAFTSSALTAYHFECTRHFESNLRLLLTFVSTPYFTQESVNKEQGIIGQEIGMIEDNPGWQLFHLLLEGLYDHHPLRVSVAGSQESISHITAETLEHCHRAFYHPGNMVLCIAGDVDPEQVSAIARMVLPAQAREQAAKDHGAPETMNAAHFHLSRAMEVSTSDFLLGFKAEPHEAGKNALRMELIGELAGELFCGTSSAVYQKLYDEGLINKTFGVGYDNYPGAAFLLMGGETDNPSKVVDLLLEEGERIRQQGISDEAFLRCKRACYGSRVRSLNSFEHCCVQLAKGEFKGYHYYHFPEVFDSITKDDVEQFLNRVLTKERAAFAEIVPKTHGKDQL